MYNEIKIKREKSIYLKCDCNCSMFVIDKTIWSDGDISYNILVQDSRYNHNHTTKLGRIKSAFKILFGKPVYYNDVYIENPEKFAKFVNQINDLCTDTLEV